MRRVLVVGASGLLGSHVVEALGATSEVIEASFGDERQPVDITSPASISGLLQRVGPVDAIICTAGMVRYVPFSEATDEDWAHGMANKLMGQVNIVRHGLAGVNDAGCIILTTGLLAQYPIPGSSIVTTVNSAVEGFVRAAALEVGRGIRINAVSPGWVAESMQAMGLDPSPGLPASEVAGRYLELLDGDANGAILAAAKAG